MGSIWNANCNHLNADMEINLKCGSVTVYMVSGIGRVSMFPAFSMASYGFHISMISIVFRDSVCSISKC